MRFLRCSAVASRPTLSEVAKIESDGGWGRDPALSEGVKTIAGNGKKTKSRDSVIRKMGISDNNEA